MKIVYSYIFDITKVLERSELIPYVSEFLGDNNLNYNNILFELSTFKLKSAKRKNYLEKLAESNRFWLKKEADCKFDKSTNEISLCGENAAAEAAEPMAHMPKSYSYKICFDGVAWFAGAEACEKADFGKYIFPLTSNISVYNYAYDGTAYISLNFAMNESGAEHIKFVELFSTHLSGVRCKKEIAFVTDDAEKVLLKKAEKQAEALLESRKRVDIPAESKASGKKAALKIRDTIKEIFAGFNFVYLGNGGYEAWKTDSYRNKISVIFDYDRENRIFSATLFYVGAGIKSGIHYSDAEELGGYIKKVREDVDEFERADAPKLAEFYPNLPAWFEW